MVASSIIVFDHWEMSDHGLAKVVYCRWARDNHYLCRSQNLVPEVTAVGRVVSDLCHCAAVAGMTSGSVPGHSPGRRRGSATVLGVTYYLITDHRSYIKSQMEFIAPGFA